MGKRIIITTILVVSCLLNIILFLAPYFTFKEIPNKKRDKSHLLGEIQKIDLSAELGDSNLFGDRIFLLKVLRYNALLLDSKEQLVATMDSNNHVQFQECKDSVSASILATSILQKALAYTKEYTDLDFLDGSVYKVSVLNYREKSYKRMTFPGVGKDIPRAFAIEQDVDSLFTLCK